MDHDTALKAAAAFEEAMAPPDLRSSAAKRQAKYRERKASQTVTNHNEASRRDGITNPSQTVTNHNNVTPLARVLDITSSTESTGYSALLCSDWPESDMLRVLVEEIASPRLDPSKSPGLFQTSGRLAAWKRDGASWQHDVLAVIRAKVGQTGPPISSFKYFDAAIAQSIADNRKALEIPAHERPSPNISPARQRRESNLARSLAGAEAALRGS